MEDCFKLIISGSGGKAVWVSVWDTSNKTLVSQVTIDMYGDYPRYKDYCNGNKVARIVRVETSPSYVGRGFGTMVMKKAIEYLDKCGYNSYLLVSPQKREGDCDTLKSVTDLKKFYEKFGFRKTGELLPTMIRKASLPTTRE